METMKIQKAFAKSWITDFRLSMIDKVIPMITKSAQIYYRITRLILSIIALIRDCGSSIIAELP